MGIKNLFALSCVVFCLLGVESQIFNEGKFVRNTRPRVLSKRPSPSLPIISEDSYVVGNMKRPTYIEAGNQWKPLYNVPTRTAQPSQKYHTKLNIFSSKYQQPSNFYPSEYQPKSPHSNQQSTANFIANQSLLVADLTGPSSIKPSPSYKKFKYQHVPKKSNNNQQYEVHEEVEDEAPSYSTENQFRFHDIPAVKSKPIKPTPSIQYSEMIGPEKHVHHVHYHDTMEEALKASATKQYVRNFRGHPTSRRPY